MEPLWYVVTIKVIRAHRKWTCTKPICFAINSGPVLSTCPSICSTTDIPHYCGIESSHCSSPFFACSVLFFFFLWNQHARSPEVSVNNTHINITICNAASCTSFISAAHTLDFTVKFWFVFRYETVLFRSYVLALLYLYIQLTISFLIGRKCTVNFQNQRLGRHLAADYTIIMSRTFKVTGNHVMYDRGA